MVRPPWSSPSAAMSRHLPSAFLLFLLLISSSTARAASGTWSIFDTPAGFDASVMMRDPSGTTLWVAGSQVDMDGNGWFIFYPQIASRSFTGTDSFASFPASGLTNATQDLVVNGMIMTKFGYPACRTSRAVSPANPLPYNQLGPRLCYYTPDTGLWAPSVTPAGEQNNWNGGPGMVIDDNGDLLACGEDLVLQSLDGGATWTTRADLRHFIMAPPPYTNVGVAAGRPAWFPAPEYVTNTPMPNPDSFDWVTGMARMPWGEIFIGGESCCYVHSLDNGQTWEWFDPCKSLPQRDMQGIPMYPNPACYRINKMFDAVATKDGEVMFNCQRNDNHHYFIWSSAGNVIESAQGLPNGSIFPGLCTQFATVKASGDTFMSLMWSNYTPSNPNPSPPSPTGHAVDIFKWDGTSWTILTSDFGALGFSTTVPNSLISDGSHVYTPTIDNGVPNIRMWTPDLSGGAPPQVTITGGNSTTTCPSTTMDPATGQASVQLSATVTSANATTQQWTARGPGNVAFEDAGAVSPKAWFTVPGNYVLNLRATDGVTHLRAGASVVVHVLPAGGGTAPAITTQPRNQIGVASGSGSATFTVAASGGGTLKYQWRRNNIDIAGNASAQTASLTIATQAADNGTAYHCVISSAYGTVVSNCAMLGLPPAIIASPVNQVVAAGGHAAFSVAASGTQPFQWQWYRNGTPINTTNDQNSHGGTFASSTPGTYSVTVSNLFGSATSGTATLTNGTPPPSFGLVVNAGSPSSSGGYVTADDGIFVSPTYPLNTPIPFGAESAPLSNFYTVFQRWSVNSGGTLASITQPQSTVTGTTANANVVVTTTYQDPTTLPLYFLNVVNGQGSGIGRAPAGSLYSTSATMNIAALPAPPGWQFDKWIGTGVASATSPQTSITLTYAANANAESTVTAHYVPTPFTAWKLAQFGANAGTSAIAGDAADPDHDGLSNLMEYALGTSPNDRTSGRANLVYDVETVGANSYLRMTITKNPAATDVTYTVQVTGDLATWTSVPTSVEINTASSLVVRDTVPCSPLNHRFIRLQVTHP